MAPALKTSASCRSRFLAHLKKWRLYTDQGKARQTAATKIGVPMLKTEDLRSCYFHACAVAHEVCSKNEVGEVAEWLMAPVLKTGIRETVSGVRIPPSPPVLLNSCIYIVSILQSIPLLSGSGKEYGYGPLRCPQESDSHPH